MPKNKCKIGGILKHTGGYGFKLTFEDKDKAQWYKEMFYYIIKSDGFKISKNDGYYDDML